MEYFYQISNTWKKKVYHRGQNLKLSKRLVRANFNINMIKLACMKTWLEFTRKIVHRLKPASVTTGRRVTGAGARYGFQEAKWFSECSPVRGLDSVYVLRFCILHLRNRVLSIRPHFNAVIHRAFIFLQQPAKIFLWFLPLSYFFLYYIG